MMNVSKNVKYDKIRLFAFPMTLDDNSAVCCYERHIDVRTSLSVKNDMLVITSPLD